MNVRQNDHVMHVVMVIVMAMMPVMHNRRRIGERRGADYRKGSDLYKRTCLLLDRIVADIRVKEESAGLA